MTRDDIVTAAQRVLGGSLDVRKGSAAEQIADAVLALIPADPDEPRGHNCADGDAALHSTLWSGGRSRAWSTHLAACATCRRSLRSRLP